MVAGRVVVDGIRPEPTPSGVFGPPPGVLHVVGGDGVGGDGRVSGVGGVCAECAIPRYRLPPGTLWLADRHGNSFCCECLTVLELTGELLALASGALRGLEGEWFP
ncbi:hypothetical protein ABZ639_25790 [Saccharomonospora sp. NPDC006951]